jgi:dihydrofolate synthase/folylpolyglutamate synthase
LDSAKDMQAMKRLTEAVAEDLEYQRLVVVLGISSDKNIAAMIDEIAPIADYIIVTAHGVMDRAANPDIIAKEIRRHSKEYSIVSDVKGAVKKALSIVKDSDLLLVTGSLFTVAEARELWAGKCDERLGIELNETPKG